MNIERHKSPYWALLSESEYRLALDPVLQWAQGTLNCKINELYHQFYYNFEEERVDFKIWCKEKMTGIVVTFEPGYPDTDFQDEWAKG
jgi:hypothetical protein